MSAPLVSVITPVFNGEQYLRSVLEAVEGQTFRDFEHVVIDDGSTDRSAAIATEFQGEGHHRVRLVSQSNQGEAAAVNRGLLEARGRYLMIVNADDPPYPHLLERTVDALESHPDCVVAYPDWDMIDASGGLIRRVETLDYSQQALVADFVCIPGPGALIRCSALEGMSLRDSRFRYVSDYDLWLRLSLRGGMVRCAERLATWRRHDSAATARGRGGALAAEFQKVIEVFFDRDDLPDDVRGWHRQAQSMAMYHAALQSLYDGSVNGRQLMVRSLLSTFRRGAAYSTHRRRLPLIIAVFLTPLSRPAVRWYEARQGGR